jgi:polar amino acid transport system substrate-binding protein
VALAVTAALAACGTGAAEEPAPGGSDRMVAAIHDALPAGIRDAGVMTVVTSGTNPPWWMTDPGQGGGYTGAGAELMDAVGEVMGVDVEIVTVPDVSGAFAAIRSGRYDVGFFPYADSVGGSRERPDAEFVDVVREVVPFLVEAGNPAGVTSLDELCDVTVAALVNAATYRAAEEQAGTCRSEGRDLDVLGVRSVPEGVLAVRSGRADAFFTGGASLFYAAEQSGGALEVVGEDAGNGFEGQFMGALLPEGSDLSQPLLDAFGVLFDDGSYVEILTSYGLEAEIIDEPGINLYSEWLAEHGGG